MQGNKNDLSAFEMLFEDFKNKLNQELNIYEKLSNEDYKQLLTSFIKEYESEFYNNFSEIFIYDYYKSLINNNVMNKILDFVQQRQSLNNQGKNEILKAERISCKDVLNFYNFDLKQNSSENMFVSGITGKAIPIKCTKSARNAQTIYKDLAGNEIEVNDGNTFINICPANAKVKIEGAQ